MAGEVKLLYVSPEKLLTRDFYNLMQAITINLIAVDEAHCISSWGHDFRPEYTKLGFLKEKFAGTPIIALTATADKVTRKDISLQLKLQDPKVFISSFDRPNLSLQVLPGKNRLKIITDFIKNKPNEAGIIYCLSRKSTQELAQKLQEEGVNAGYYHAALPAGARAKAQEDFINDKVPVICATIAFGMGIDKSNVRWVIHYNLPKNIEGYYQEIGRAGRDGLKSQTLLFYSFRDITVLRSFIEENDREEVQLAKLQRMQQYAESHTCRRKVLLAYFGEHLEQDCGNCDVCHNPPVSFDGTRMCQMALSAMARLKEQVGMGMLIDVLRGSGKRDLLEKGYQNIKTYGAGSNIPYSHWQQYLLQMLNQGLFEIAYDEGYALKITASGKEVLFNGKTVDLVQLDEISKRIKESAEKAKPKTKKQQIKGELFEALRQLRLQISKEENIPPYRVFSDATLMEMAGEKPTTEEEMKDISGVGERKYALYGHAFIDQIISFVKKKAEEGEKIKGSTYQLTHEYLKEGMSVEAIAEKRKLHATTIYSHVAYLYEKGHDIDIHQFIQEEEIKQVHQAIAATGETESLKPLFDHLKEAMPYHKIRLGVAIYKKPLASP